MQVPGPQHSNGGAGGAGHSVFGRLSGVLHNDRGQQHPKPSASPPKGGHAAGSQFADLRTRLSSRFKSASSPDQPAPDD